ncbi:DUF7281 domain-containing protein [Shewanella sp. OMA3-2]|uniref:DUF7281 domain-containing protein n=1 Tax=Shewanella sp. OMA3-2 TaxID=2908650 RepID=UPI001F216F56|nr:hypothetical protein [Shewanella sp. OMA3-2]UJF21833.1 hypothetical protein L0B17_17665 [Shewanella sp. OMA3-2]
MAKLTRTQLDVIKTVVTKRLPRTKLTSNWRQISQLFDIGEVDGASKWLSFGTKDHALLQEMAQLDSGFDVLNTNFNQPRSTLAAKGKKEKYANIRPDANYVLVKLPIQCYPSLAAQYSLRMTVEQLIAICLQFNLLHLIVVENLDSFDDVLQFKFDPLLASIISQAVIVYRGSGAHSPAGCKRLLHVIAQNQELQPKMQISAFTDLDPAGLQIAHLLQGCSQLIAPVVVNQTAIEQFQRLQQPQPFQIPQQAQLSPLILTLNDPDDFDKQWRQQKYLNKAALDDWRKLVNLLQQHRISIKQQHMLAHQLELTLIPISE